MQTAAVLFDAVGTLIHPEPRVAEAYYSAGVRHGSQLAIGEIDRRFRRAFAAEEAPDAADGTFRTDEARELRRWRSIVAAVFDDVAVDAQAALFDDLWRHFSRPTSWRTFDDVRPTLARLQAAGRIVAVGSNFDARLGPILAELLPEVAASRVFASSLVGRRKPSAEFFAACLARLGLTEPRQLLVVGDDVANDCSGPHGLGYPVILLDRRGRHAAIEPRISTLAELV